MPNKKKNKNKNILISLSDDLLFELNAELFFLKLGFKLLAYHSGREAAAATPGKPEQRGT